MSSPPAPTEYKTTTRNITPVQSGSARSDGDTYLTYDDANPGFLFPILLNDFATLQALRFQLYNPYVTNGPGISSLVLNISVEWGIFVDVPEQVWVIFDPTSVTQAYTAGPPILGAPQAVRPVTFLPSLGASGWSQIGYDDGSGWTINVGDTGEISLPLGELQTDVVSGSTYRDMSGLFHLLYSGWDGMLNIGVQIERGTGIQPTNLVSATLAVEEFPFNTGMMVGEGQLKRRARVVHSYKSGFPYLSDEATADGYTDGIMMHPDDYDPIDPVAQGQGDYVQSPTEGVIDDEVTDLEG